MKIVAILVVSVILTIGLGVATFQHYKTNKEQREQSVQAAEAARTEQIERLKRDNAALVGSIDGLRTECFKGVIAYDAHTALNKSKLARPVCGEVLTD